MVATTLIFVALATTGVHDFPDIDLQSAAGRRIEAIEVEIEGSLERDGLLRHFRLGVGDAFDAEAWATDTQLLLNRGIFSHVHTRARAVGDEGVALHLRVETTFSLLPYLAFQGGTVPIGIVGAYYANLLGELVEVGGYYMRRGPYDLGRGWVVLPNVLTYGSLLEVELVMSGELMLDYPSPTGLADGIERGYPADRYPWLVPEGGVEVLRRGFFVDFGYRIFPEWLLVSVRYLLLFEEALALPNVRAVVDADNRGRPAADLARAEAEHTRLSILALSAIVGQVALVDNHRYEGQEFRAVAAISSALLGSEREFLWVYLTYRNFVHLGADFDLAARATLAHSTSIDRRDLFNLGGFNLEPFIYNERNPGILTIRGFRDWHRRGQNLWFVNIEPRYTPFHDIQLPLVGGLAIGFAGFVDLGYAYDGPILSDRFAEDVSISAGVGVLTSLKRFRYTYVNWYYAHSFHPINADTFGLVLTRPFF